MYGAVAVTERLYVLIRRAGLPGGRSSHSLRRAVGTRLVELGWSLAQVGQVLGHTTQRSTLLYLRLSVDLLRDVANNYGDLL